MRAGSAVKRPTPALGVDYSSDKKQRAAFKKRLLLKNQENSVFFIVLAQRLPLKSLRLPPGCGDEW
jgi:hypothetical protein